MKRIAVLNPNMTTVEQSRLGLSHFGLLSRLFTLELASRVRQAEGLWQALALELLEDGEKEEQPPPAPEIQLNLDLKIITKALREELARQPERASEKKETEKKPDALTVEQRVLERILLRERELWKAGGMLPRGVSGLRMVSEGKGAATLSSRERYVLLSARREAPRQTIAAFFPQTLRAGGDVPRPAGQPLTLPVSYAAGTTASPAAERARLTGRFDVGAVAGYRASRSRFPFGDIFDRQAFGMYSAGLAPLLYGDGAPPVFGAGDTPGDAFARNAAPRQYAPPTDLFYPDGEPDEGRAEARGGESPARPVQPPRQSAAISARAARNESLGLRERSAAAEASAGTAPRSRTPALLGQRDTAARMISTLARIQAQKESRRSQDDAQRPSAGAAAEETAAFPGVVESIPKARSNLTLASQTTTAPAGDGWAPQWRPEHPDVAAKAPERENAPGGSILFPDLLRYRREQAISGKAPQEESRLPAALSAALKDAADRERTTRAMPAERSDDRYARGQAVQQKVPEETARRNDSQQWERERAARQDAAETPAETERVQTAPRHDDTASFTEAARAARAIPASDSAAATLSPEPAELEYNTQAELQTAQPAREQAARQSVLPNAPAASRFAPESKAAEARQGAAETPAETERVQTMPRYDDAASFAEAERAARAVPASDSAAATLSPESAELEYKEQEQAAQPEREAARQSAPADAPAVSQAAAESGTAEARQRLAAETPAETERVQTAPRYDDAAPFAETEQAARAIPASDSVAATLSPESAELEYKAQEQAAQPEREQAARQSVLPDAPAVSQAAAESKAVKTRQGAAETPAETERVQTAPRRDDAAPFAETERAARAIPVSESAAATLSPEPAELEYNTQAELQTAQPVRERAARQSASADAPAASQADAESKAAEARQRHAAETPAETERARTARGTPVADSVAPHGIPRVLRTLAHGDTPRDTFDTQRLADSVSARHSPLANASRQSPRESKTGRTSQAALTNPPPAPAPRASAAWDARLELTYTQALRTPQETPAEDSGEAKTERQTKSPFAQELPSWARAVLRQNGGQLPPPGAQSEPFDSKKAGASGGHINWSAPYAIPPGMRPAEKGRTSPDAGQSAMVFRNLNEAEREQTQRGGELDERTARKMAEKVYKIIEERLRKELRRGGK